MAYTTNATVAPFNANDDIKSLPPGPALKENAKSNFDFSRIGAFLDAPPMDKDTPSNYIPGLYTLGATYNVLNGKYADSKSTIQQVIDWNKSDVRIQEFGPKNYSIPEVVNFNLEPTSTYRSSYGKTTTEYTKSLSVHAGFEASFPGFSASASADYSASQRENLSHAFTRVTYAVTHYNLSLPPTEYVQPLLKAWFVNDLDTKDPIELYKQYGTHLLRSLTIGGRALFLTSTDTRSYKAELSLEAAAKISASYLVADGEIDISAKQKEAMESFNESSEYSIVTKGGDPRYGNENFLKNVEAWAASIIDYPDFVEFGSLPCLTGLWELASTPERRGVLQKAYAQFVTLYTQDLAIPGPFLRARLTQDFDSSKVASMTIDGGSYINYQFPSNRSDGWYYITPAATQTSAVVVQELVPGALAPVKQWQLMFLTPGPYSSQTAVWRAIPPSPDYVAMGVVCYTISGNSSLPLEPPPSLAGHFRAVHKSALTAAVNGVTWYANYWYEDRKFFSIDKRYWFADTQFPLKADCFRLDPKGVIQEGDGWE
ncbi:hypothetical protein BC835DRAFT_1421168 [Cytidiella melzeri]|nr:hypothetical protein BC835DRAFT_1421168 [Cytidiella melzeri]